MAGYELREEELLFDAMVDAAYEARWNDAVEWLKEHEGDREFTDEEIETAAEGLDEWAVDDAWADAYDGDPYK